MKTHSAVFPFHAIRKYTKNVLVCTGKAHTEERRLVVRRDVMGDLDGVRAETVRGADERAGGGEQQSLVPGRRPAEGGAEAAGVSAGDLRPDGRVLEASGGGQTTLLGDPSLPAAQEPRLRPRHRITQQTLPLPFYEPRTNCLFKFGFNSENQ